MLKTLRLRMFVTVSRLMVLCAVTSLWMAEASAADRWHRWGGPTADFKVDASGLADKWPDTGPPKIWSRTLGDGYSAIAYDDGRLFTLYRKDEREIVVALDAATGKNAWSHSYSAPLSKEYITEFGVGPRAMPLIVGDRIYTVGINGTFHCFDKKSGKVLWSHELVKDLGGTLTKFGYSSTPIAYKNTIVLPVGGKGHALVAFDAKSGSVVWMNLDFDNSHATPVLIDLDGEDQLVAFMAKEVIGVDPSNGNLKWRVEHENRWHTNCSTPVWGPDNLLFVTTEEFGSRVIKLDRDGDKTNAQEVWFKRNPQVVFSNVIRIGDYLYGCCGIKTAPLTAFSVKTGEVAWKVRDFNKAMCLYADGKFIILDEDGHLGLATLTPQGAEVHSKFELFEKNAWTVPTLIGTKLFARDRKTIVALELGKPGKRG